MGQATPWLWVGRACWPYPAPGGLRQQSLTINDGRLVRRTLGVAVPEERR
jgi:hypothetical protein